jgi:hypothetical protein
MTTRDEQVKKRGQGDGQAWLLSNMKISCRYIDPNYCLILHDGTRGETGRLDAFSLSPKSQGKPTFKARIDDGSPGKRRPPDLDIDIECVPKKAKKAFNNKCDGYAGHHNDRSPDAERRIFDVMIKTPQGIVFDGEVTFDVTFAVSGGMHATTAMNVQMEKIVVRAVPPQPGC